MITRYTYPVPTQSWYSRGNRVFVHLEYLDSDTQSTPPGFPVDYSETVSYAGDEPFLLRNHTGPMFPADLLPSRYGSGFAGKMNRADVMGNGFVNPTTQEVSYYNQDQYGPLAPREFRTASGDRIHYEDFSTNAIYNVKTWRLSGTLGSKTIDVTAASGTTQSFNTENEPDNEPERPNDGRRGPYPTHIRVSGSISSGEQGEQGYAHIDIGGLATTGLSADVEEVYHLEPVPYVLVPRFIAAIATQDGAQYSAGFPSQEEGSEDQSLTFLGQPVYTFTDSGTKPHYNLRITAEERWNEEDEWVPKYIPPNG